MGTEIKLYAGRVVGNWDPESCAPNWLIKLGEFELSKWPYDGELSALRKRDDAPRVFFYADDGNTRVHKDKYGLPCLAFPIDWVIDAMAADYENREWFNPSEEPFWVLTALRALRDWYAEATDRYKLSVVLFGH